MKKPMPRYYLECGAPLVSTPGGFASCPNMHGRLQPTLTEKVFAELAARAGIDCRALPMATRKGNCWAVDGAQGQYRLRRPDDGDWKDLIREKRCTLAHNADRVLILVNRTPSPARPPA